MIEMISENPTQFGVLERLVSQGQIPKFLTGTEKVTCIIPPLGIRPDDHLEISHRIVDEDWCYYFEYFSLKGVSKGNPLVYFLDLETGKNLEREVQEMCKKYNIKTPSTNRLKQTINELKIVLFG